MTKEEFVQYDNNWNSHRPLLWEALCELLKQEPPMNPYVFEFGIGHGSTPFLADFCNNNVLYLLSFENNKEWFSKFDPLADDHTIHFVHDWDSCDFMVDDNGGLIEVGLLFIDHAPGERRKVDIAKWANHAKIIVAHDTEPAADHGYQMRAELKKFKYMLDYETNGAWATAVSNFIDVTKWKPWRKES